MDYADLNKKIQQKYRRAFRGRDVAFEFMDYYLRLIESSTGEDVLKPAIKGKLQNNFARWISDKLLLIYIYWFSARADFVFFRTMTFSKVYSSLICASLARRKASVKGVLTNEILSSRKLKAKYFYDQGCVFELFRRSMHFYCVLNEFHVFDLVSLKTALKSDLFLDKLEVAVKADTKNALQVMRYWQPKALVMNADQTPEAHAIVKAAASFGVKTCVIAHGYFKNPWWVSVLPLYVDRLYVWTEDVRKRVLEADSKNSVYTLGGVKWRGIDKASQVYNRILVAGSPLYQYESNPRHLAAFKDAIAELGNIKNTLGYDVFYKPHPLECNDMLLDKILERHGILKISGDIYRLAAESLVVCGGLTSFLYEAVQSDIIAVQIEELSVFEPRESFDGVPQCPARNLGEFILDLIQTKRGGLGADPHIQEEVDDFVSWLIGEAI